MSCLVTAFVKVLYQDASDLIFKVDFFTQGYTYLCAASGNFFLMNLLLLDPHLPLSINLDI